MTIHTKRQPMRVFRINRRRPVGFRDAGADSLITLDFDNSSTRFGKRVNLNRRCGRKSKHRANGPGEWNFGAITDVCWGFRPPTPNQPLPKGTGKGQKLPPALCPLPFCPLPFCRRVDENSTASASHSGESTSSRRFGAPRVNWPRPMRTSTARTSADFVEPSSAPAMRTVSTRSMISTVTAMSTGSIAWSWHRFGRMRSGQVNPNANNRRMSLHR